MEVTRTNKSLSEDALKLLDESFLNEEENNTQQFKDLAELIAASLEPVEKPKLTTASTPEAEQKEKTSNNKENAIVESNNTLENLNTKTEKTSKKKQPNFATQDQLLVASRIAQRTNIHQQQNENLIDSLKKLRNQIESVRNYRSNRIIKKNSL